MATCLAVAACGDNLQRMEVGGSPDGGMPIPVPDAGVAATADSGPSEVITPCPLERLGGLENLAGGAIGVGPDTFLTIGGKAKMMLHLAERSGTGLSVLATTRLPTFVSDPTQVVGATGTGGLVALGEVGDRELQLVSVESAAVRARGTITLPGQLVNLALRNARLWVCTGDFINGHLVSLFDVTDPDAPSSVGSLVMPRDCGSVAIDDVGAHVYVNTADGVRYIDATPLDTGGVPTLADVFTTPASVSTAPGALLLRGTGTVRILRQSDLGEVTHMDAPGVLATSLTGGHLLLEGFRVAGTGMEGYASLWDPTGATRLDELLLMTVPIVGDPPPAFRSAVTTDGSSVIARLGSRLFDLGGGRLDEKRDPQLVPMDQLQPEGSATLRAFGTAGSALIDISDPHAPAFASGGSYGVPMSLAPALDETTATPRLVLGLRLTDPAQVDVGRPTDPNPLVIARRRLDATGRVQITGSFRLPSPGPGLLLAAGDALYRVRAATAGSPAHFERWPRASLGSAGEVATADLDLTLVPSPPLAQPATVAVFDVDPLGRRAVVAVSNNTEAALFWIDLAATPPRIVEQVRPTDPPRHLRVVGTRAVALYGLAIDFLELGRGQVSRLSSGEAFLDHLVAFDGRVATFGQALPFGLGSAGFGQSGVTGAPLLLDDIPRTVVAVGGSLVAGLPGELVVVAPHCAPP